MSTLPAPSLLVLDFDGVVADSELLANQALAEFLTEAGRPTSLDDAIRQFMGRRHADVRAAMADWLGRPVPETYDTVHRERTRRTMRETVQPVEGVAAFLAARGALPVCVASSSQHEWLDHCVDRFGFRDHFGRNLFSASEVANGKPAPDIFLHAAQRMGVAPGACWVVEDSPAGVEGARAAGMTVIGFLGGSHIRDGHAARLEAAGAHMTAESFRDVAALMARG